MSQPYLIMILCGQSHDVLSIIVHAWTRALLLLLLMGSRIFYARNEEKHSLGPRFSQSQQETLTLPVVPVSMPDS